MHAVKNRGFRAGLDVFENEPSADGPVSNVLVGFEGVYGTHHIGASTTQAQQAVAMEAVRIILAFADSGQAPNCVNLGNQGLRRTNLSSDTLTESACWRLFSTD